MVAIVYQNKIGVRDASLYGMTLVSRLRVQISEINTEEPLYGVGVEFKLISSILTNTFKKVWNIFSISSGKISKEEYPYYQRITKFNLKKADLKEAAKIL